MPPKKDPESSMSVVPLPPVGLMGEASTFGGGICEECWQAGGDFARCKWCSKTAHTSCLTASRSSFPSSLGGRESSTQMHNLPPKPPEDEGVSRKEETPPLLCSDCDLSGFSADRMSMALWDVAGRDARPKSTSSASVHWGTRAFFTAFEDGVHVPPSFPGPPAFLLGDGGGNSQARGSSNAQLLLQAAAAAGEVLASPCSSSSSSSSSAQQTAGLIGAAAQPSEPIPAGEGERAQGGSSTRRSSRFASRQQQEKEKETGGGDETNKAKVGEGERSSTGEGANRVCASPLEGGKGSSKRGRKGQGPGEKKSGMATAKEEEEVRNSSSSSGVQFFPSSSSPECKEEDKKKGKGKEKKTQQQKKEETSASPSPTKMRKTENLVLPPVKVEFQEDPEKHNAVSFPKGNPPLLNNLKPKPTLDIDEPRIAFPNFGFAPASSSSSSSFDPMPVVPIQISQQETERERGPPTELMTAVRRGLLLEERGGAANEGLGESAIGTGGRGGNLPEEMNGLSSSSYFTACSNAVAPPPAHAPPGGERERVTEGLLASLVPDHVPESQTDAWADVDVGVDATDEQTRAQGWMRYRRFITISGALRADPVPIELLSAPVRPADVPRRLCPRKVFSGALLQGALNRQRAAAGGRGGSGRVLSPRGGAGQGGREAQAPRAASSSSPSQRARAAAALSGSSARFHKVIKNTAKGLLDSERERDTATKVGEGEGEGGAVHGGTERESGREDVMMADVATDSETGGRASPVNTQSNPPPAVIEAPPSLDDYMSHMAAVWADKMFRAQVAGGDRFPFNADFGLQLLAQEGYHMESAMRRLCVSSFQDLRATLSMPSRPYMNKWRPGENRGSFPATPFPPCPKGALPPSPSPPKHRGGRRGGRRKAGG
uniref:Extended EGL-27 and MTA1 homology domain-containing protein n=1 Tax=Chromera velia CCMP2878 TaxID=1169474 RepID=A0A0G4HRS9_9ALVE|eukprot:Cvel_8128.t1-p1 / transcript=Cvel_8128.t1 / gene=Cvel_8128 / organism=Chromera_velia_CCMP2878 / gene_product=hypothetical protein / transcript_product=hypothetical protein / location=Cvel_scaffold442:23431-30128(+) / protein_length=887 / sequence_SO=supercontig / SO=protein_coding / is_pseudo=false